MTAFRFRLKKRRKPEISKIALNGKLKAAGLNPQSAPLPGHVSFQRKDSGVYGVYAYSKHEREKTDRR
jgi:hypothetical protein